MYRNASVPSTTPTCSMVANSPRHLRLLGFAHLAQSIEPLCSPFSCFLGLLPRFEASPTLLGGTFDGLSSLLCFLLRPSQ
jgi:hypothetical protein